MDCKSVDDLAILSRESIIKEYNLLYGCYNELKVSEQRQLQEIHLQRRELQLALNDKNHLSSELEIINSEHVKEIENIQGKHREELHELKDRLLASKRELELVESVRDNLEAILDDLKKESVEQKQIVPNVAVDNNHSFYVDKVAQLELENDELAEAVEILKAELTEALKMNLQNENKIEDLLDRLRCTEENLKTKRDELEERNEMYETAQERVIELSGELNAIRTESDTATKRGNSLFAEVDDQRQKMRALLVAQKANYIEMKNELEKSQQEVRKLKRENTAMYKEMEVCSHIFLNAEQHHTEKLNERIAELMSENEAINKKLTFTEECLSEMIKKNDVKWLDPMIALCNNESNDLKDKLYRCSLQKVTIAGTLRQCEEESARWRFEALKSRCIIADRESLLEDNKIPFSTVSDIDKRIRKIDNENVSPNIACRPSMLGFKRRSTTKLQPPQGTPVAMPVKTVSQENTLPSNPSVNHSELTNDMNELQVKDIKEPHPKDMNGSNLKNMDAPHSKDIGDPEDELKKLLEADGKPMQKHVIAETVKPKYMDAPHPKDMSNPEDEFKKLLRADDKSMQNHVTADTVTPNKIKIVEKTIPQMNFSGVTIRKKMNSSTTTIPAGDHLRSAGTCLPSILRPKIYSQTNSAGILKPTSSPNVPVEKKVKFLGGSSIAKKTPAVLTSELKGKVDSAPKTAIKKRIFISSKKSSN